METTASSAPNETSLDDHQFRLESAAPASLDADPIQGKAGGGRRSSDGGGLRPESSNAEERAAFGAGIAKHPPAHNTEGLTFRGGSAVEPETVKRCPPSVVGGPSDVASEEGRRRTLRRISSAGDEQESSKWVTGTSGQHLRRLQETEGTGKGVACRGSATRSSDHRNADATGGEKLGKRCLPRASGFGGDEASGTGGLAQPPTLRLPWDDATNPGPARIPSRGGPTGSPASDTACGGNASARTLGVTGTAVAGLTYPGPRPLSAPLVRASISAARLNSTSPILSGRRFEGTSVTKGGHGGSTRDGSRSLGRAAGASLAGTVMSYATRPGGTFDVFAAARDGQVGQLWRADTFCAGLLQLHRQGCCRIQRVTSFGALPLLYYQPQLNLGSPLVKIGDCVVSR